MEASIQQEPGSFHEYIHIWNPAIRKVIRICSEENGNPDIGCVYKFWYDMKENDCKIAKICYNLREPKKVYEVYVFSLAAGSWKIIVNGTLLDIDSQILCVNGELHWLSYRYYDYEDLPFGSLLISLNLNTGKFRENLIPRSATKQVFGYIIGELDTHSIVLFACNDKESCISIQVYDTDLNHFYWIDFNDNRYQYPLGFTYKGEVLFQDYEKMFSYNLETKTYKDFGIGTYDNVESTVKHNDPDIAGSYTIGSIFPFVETLVLLDNKGCN